MAHLVFQVGWSESGDAVFHPDCWSSLVQATKKNPSKKTDLQLNDLETSLVVEAKKHAEFHDSDAMVKSEAARIAQLIKEAKHCIAFTGICMTKGTYNNFLLTLGKFFLIFCRLLIYFFQNLLFQKIPSGYPSEWQTVLIQNVRPDLDPKRLQRLPADDIGK